MQRWHKVQEGRIVASCECATGEAAEVLLGEGRRTDGGTYGPRYLIVSDADWRAVHYRRALLRVGRRKMSAEQWTHELKRRANGLQA